MGLFRRRGENPNAVAGVFLLILLLAITGPNILPRLTASIPVVDEGVPCRWLREGEQRAMHQSLIGRSASLVTASPISLAVETTALSSASTNLVVTITVINDTIGTVPFLLINDTVAVGINTNVSGLGVAFNATAPVPAIGATTTSYPENQIRLLGPRQRCVHRISFAVTELQGTIGGFGGDTITAFYRNGSRGTASPTAQGQQIYADQGLWTGVVQSLPYTISVAQ
ncbi:MAG: hypothetical protein RLP44_09790 [Aggregatilineales bacterium]